MWFTDESPTVPRVGRIDPATGTVSMFELPTVGKGGFAGLQPLQITAGPDGALWFAVYRAAVVGRIDVAGHITRYQVRGGGLTRTITAGPDGALWFTEEAPDSIGRLDPTTGAVTLHHVRSALGNAAPAGIAAGPDGALWFTESGTSAIGRLDPATGKMKTIPTPTANAFPLGIVAGPDGALWFTEGAAGNVGRVDPATGKVTEYPLSSALDAPLQIALGSGALWVSEAGVNTIARIDPSNTPSGAANHPVVPSYVAAPFQNQCPTAHICITQVNTGGTLRIKSFTQQLPPGAIRLTGYLSPPANPDGSFTLQPPLSGQQLDSQPVPVPGGLLGTIPLLGPIVGPLVGPANDLSVSLTLAGPVNLTLAPLGATVPVTLHLNNLVLGSNCTIGPVVQHLLFAKTAAGQNDPATTWWSLPIDGGDQTFSVPGAQGCGAIPLVFDAVIDTQLGLPSSSGNNTVDLPAVLSEGPGLHP
jgi:streptogramin lyase